MTCDREGLQQMPIRWEVLTSFLWSHCLDLGQRPDPNFSQVLHGIENSTETLFAEEEVTGGNPERVGQQPWLPCTRVT